MLDSSYGVNWDGGYRIINHCPFTNEVVKNITSLGFKMMYEKGYGSRFCGLLLQNKATRIFQSYKCQTLVTKLIWETVCYQIDESETATLMFGVE